MRKTVETIMGVVFFSDDNWETVWKQTSPKHVRRIFGRDADLARFLAVVKYGGGRDAPKKAR